MTNLVPFTYKNGRERKMLERDAKILTKLGRGTYLTADMRAAPAPAPAPVPVLADPLDGMDAESLHELAKREGVKVHPNAGAERVRAAIRTARQGGE